MRILRPRATPLSPVPRAPPIPELEVVGRAETGVALRVVRRGRHTGRQPAQQERVRRAELSFVAMSAAESEIDSLPIRDGKELYFACRQGQLTRVRKHLARGGQEGRAPEFANLTDANARLTGVFGAALGAHSDILSILITMGSIESGGRRVNPLVNYQDRYGYTPLMAVASNGWRKPEQLPDGSPCPEDAQLPPAIRQEFAQQLQQHQQRQAQCVQTLLQANADPAIRSLTGPYAPEEKTALRLAAESGQQHIVQLLQQHGIQQ